MILQALCDALASRRGFFPEKLTFPDLLDMYFVVFDILVQYFVKIAKVAMGGSPKQG
jgi:hypothetical protein